MHLKAGQAISTHVLKEGTEVTLRAPRMEDLDDAMEFINALVDEKAMMIVDQHRHRDRGGHPSGVLAEVEMGKAAYVFAEIEGRVVASSSITFKSGHKAHLHAGIAISKRYRGIGLGTVLMMELMTQARRFGKKLIVLEAFEKNSAQCTCMRRSVSGKSEGYPRSCSTRASIRRP